MPDRSMRRRALALLGAVTLVAGLIPTVSAADPTKLTATTLTPSSRVTGFKSTSAKLAKSDPALLKRTDSALVNVMIKLDYDATASYAGGIDGFAATSPRVTGKDLTGKSAAETRYTNHIKATESSFIKALAARVSERPIGQAFRTVYGGISAADPGERGQEPSSRSTASSPFRTDKAQPPADRLEPRFHRRDPLYRAAGR